MLRLSVCVTRRDERRTCDSSRRCRGTHDGAPPIDLRRNFRLRLFLRFKLHGTVRVLLAVAARIFK